MEKSKGVYCNMKKKIIDDIQQKMRGILNNEQRKKLQEVLEYSFYDVEVVKIDTIERDIIDYSNIFVAAKKVEGCSDRTLNYYKTTIDNMLNIVNKRVNNIETDDLRRYLADYQYRNSCSKVTIDNVRRILSSFFCMA